MRDRELPARYCFGCGDLNPRGLHLRFRQEGDQVVSEFTPSPEHQGWPGMVHGGLVATLLDEAMGWALAACNIWAVTGKMEMHVRQPAPLGEPLAIRGRILRDRGKALVVRGELTTVEGQLLAEAQGLFLRVPKGREQELKVLYGAEEGGP